MSESDRRAFEAQMEADAALRDDVARMRVLDTALEVAVEDDLRARLQQMADPAPVRKTPEPVTRTFRSRWAVAAGILIIVCAGLWYLIGGGSALSEFRSDHYLAYDYTQVRGDLASRDDFPFDIRSGDFDREAAAPWFESWLETHPDDHEARFILAQILHDLGNTQRAKAALSIIMQNNSVLWTEKAEWNYLLLSAGKDWDEFAEETLNSILADPAHAYHPQAVELQAIMNAR